MIHNLRHPESLPLSHLADTWHLLGNQPKRIEALRDLPPLGLAGPSLGGIGIPACLTSGERAAVEVLDRLGA